MKSTLRLGLRSGEKICINGAVVRVDRKVRLELLNDATFLLESHVMAPEEATSSLHRLYFLVQSILIDPSLKDALRPSLAASIELIVREELDTEGIEAMRSIAHLLDAGSYFAALKEIRSLTKRTQTEATVPEIEAKKQEELA